MISNRSRAYWFGGSDYSKVMASNRNTVTWQNWWQEKIGGQHKEWSNIYVEAGNMYEHPILEALGLTEADMDRTLYLPEYRLRINLDGDKDGWIYEVKTHKPDKVFEVTEQYRGQCQLEMFAYQNTYGLPPFKGLKLVDYPILDYSRVRINPLLINVREIKYNPHIVKRFLRKERPLLERLWREER